MTSLFPATVPTLPLRRNKGGRPRTVRQKDDYYGDGVERGGSGSGNESDNGSQTGVGARLDGGSKASDQSESLGGVELEHGQRGGVRLLKSAQGWKWEFAYDEGWGGGIDVDLEAGADADMSGEGQGDLHVKSSGYVLGATDSPPELLVPPSRIIHEAPPPIDTSASLEYLRQMCSKYEHLGLDELVGPELEAEALSGARHSTDAPKHGHRSSYPGSDDPYLGSTLRIMPHPQGRIARSLVVYPSGELGNELCIAAFAPKSNRVLLRKPLTRFIPCSFPLEQYPTSILQIDSSPAQSPHQNDKHGTPLIIRLHSSTHLYFLRPNFTYEPEDITTGPPAHLIHLASLTTSDTAGRRHADVALDPGQWLRAVIVDQGGGVWVWEEVRLGDLRGLAGREMNLRQVRPAVPQLSRADVDRWRVVWSTVADNVVVASNREVVAIDIGDSKNPVTNLLSLPAPTRVIDIERTAFERESSHISLVTSNAIIWLDVNTPGSPVLSWKHEMGSKAAALQIKHVPHPVHERYALYTTGGSTITMFHVSTDSPVRLLCSPYSLTLNLDSPPLISGSLNTYVEYALIDVAEPTGRQAQWRVIALGSDGSVRACALREGVRSGLDGEEVIHEGTRLQTVWDDDTQRVHREGPVESLPEDGVEKRQTAKRMYDFRWAWAALHESHEPEAHLTPQELGRYLRELDAPFEHLMTVAELARDAVKPPPVQDYHSVRSHHLRPLSLASTLVEDLTGYTALPFTRDFVSVFPSLTESTGLVRANEIDGVSSHHLTSIKGVYDLLLDTYPLPFVPESNIDKAHRRHLRDIAELALDLIWSRIVLSSDELPTVKDAAEDVAASHRGRRIAGRGDMGADEVLAQAASLSLNERDPPKVVLHVYKPKVDFADGDDEPDGDDGERMGADLPTPALHSTRHDQAQPQPQPRSGLDDMTVRTLLADWMPGSDPSGYEWKSWLDTDDTTLQQHEQVQSTAPRHDRPIRPLPSPRGSPRPRQGQPGRTFAGREGIASSLPLFAQYAPAVYTPRPTSSQSYAQAQPQPQAMWPSQGGGIGIGLGVGVAEGSSQRKNVPRSLQLGLPSLSNSQSLPQILSTAREGQVGEGMQQSSTSRLNDLGLPGVVTNTRPDVLHRAYRQASPRSSPPGTPGTPSRRRSGMNGNGKGNGDGVGSGYAQHQQGQVDWGGTATQVERGVYGGRMGGLTGMAGVGGLGTARGGGGGGGVGKKKPKKRLGGF